MSRKEELLANLAQVKLDIPDGVTLVVVTKTYPVSDVEILYEAGVRDFGENRDQEGAQKAPQLPSDANWHFQGQIQSNKLSSIASWADYIHSLDKLDHAKKLNKFLVAPKPVFIQVSLDGQTHRGGIDPKQIPALLDEIEKLKMVSPIGLMAVAPLDEDADRAYSKLAQIKADISKEFSYIKYLSAGMSGDYKVAISHGATHVRIGSSILGSRG